MTRNETLRELIDVADELVCLARVGNKPSAYLLNRAENVIKNATREWERHEEQMRIIGSAPSLRTPSPIRKP